MGFEEERRRLVSKLIREGILKSKEVIDAFLKVPREEFVPRHLKRLAYADMPLPIGHGQTISAPHMVAIMTEALAPRKGNKVLEVGTGSGYQAAILAEIVGDEGHVWTIERIPALAEFARENLRRTSYARRVTVIVGDGSKGYPDAMPYDRIIVTAAAPDVPEPLIEQLAPGGRLVIPVGDSFTQRLLILEKRHDGSIIKRWGTYCVFVPLIGEYGFRERDH